MSLLNDIITGASEAYQANQNADAADALKQAKASEAAAASANASASNSTTKWLLIGGGVLVLAIVGVFALRKS